MSSLPGLIVIRIYHVSAVAADDLKLGHVVLLGRLVEVEPQEWVAKAIQASYCLFDLLPNWIDKPPHVASPAIFAVLLDHYLAYKHGSLRVRVTSICSSGRTI